MVPGESSRRSTASAAYLQRPLELQDSLNRYCYHPLAWRLAKRLAPCRSRPTWYRSSEPASWWLQDYSMSSHNGPSLR